MMKTNLILSLFLCIAILGQSNGDPFLFFPESMLPPIGTTYNFTFDGLAGTWNISGIYTVQAVTDDDGKTILGYRNWQLYTGDLNQTFYGVSYKNNTYPQASINPQTQECENVFSETVNCTGWTSTEKTEWDNRCSIVRVNSSITGDMALTVQTSSTVLTLPVYFRGTTSISGVPVNMTVIYYFRSRTEEKIFPPVKCYF